MKSKEDIIGHLLKDCGVALISLPLEEQEQLAAELEVKAEEVRALIKAQKACKNLSKTGDFMSEAEFKSHLPPDFDLWTLDEKRYYVWLLRQIAAKVELQIQAAANRWKLDEQLHFDA